MAERIKARLGRKIAVSTFHSLGLTILGEAEGRRPNLSKLAEDTRLFRKTIARFIDDAAADPAYRSSLVHFFATLLLVPKPPEAFASRDAYLQDVRSVELRTLKNELVKGFGELAIAKSWRSTASPMPMSGPIRSTRAIHGGKRTVPTSPSPAMTTTSSISGSIGRRTQRPGSIATLTLPVSDGNALFTSNKARRSSRPSHGSISRESSTTS